MAVAAQSDALVDVDLTGSTQVGQPARWPWRRVASCLWLSLVSTLPACGSDSPTTPSSSSLLTVVISGNLSLSAVGQTSQLTATAGFQDGTTQPVTTTATWQSSNVT